MTTWEIRTSDSPKIRTNACTSYIPAFLKLFSASAPLSTIYPRYRPPPENLNILLHLYLFNDNKDYLLV